MKRLLIIVLLLGVAFGAFGQDTILYRDNFTLLFNEPVPPPTLLPGESMTYRVYLWDIADGAPTPVLGPNWVYYAETPILEQFVVTPADPRVGWCVGVQSVITRADAVEVLSDLAYTTNVADIDPLGDPGVPFVYALDSETALLGSPEALRDSGI